MEEKKKQDFYDLTDDLMEVEVIPKPTARKSVSPNKRKMLPSLNPENKKKIQAKESEAISLSDLSDDSDVVEIEKFKKNPDAYSSDSSVIQDYDSEMEEGINLEMNIFEEQIEEDSDSEDLNPFLIVKDPETKMELNIEREFILNSGKKLQICLSFKKNNACPLEKTCGYVHVSSEFWQKKQEVKQKKFNLPSINPSPTTVLVQEKPLKTPKSSTATDVKQMYTTKPQEMKKMNFLIPSSIHTSTPEKKSKETQDIKSPVDISTAQVLIQMRERKSKETHETQKVDSPSPKVDIPKIEDSLPKTTSVKVQDGKFDLSHLIRKIEVTQPTPKGVIFNTVSSTITEIDPGVVPTLKSNPTVRAVQLSQSTVNSSPKKIHFPFPQIVSHSKPEITKINLKLEEFQKIPEIESEPPTQPLVKKIHIPVPSTSISPLQKRKLDHILPLNEILSKKKKTENEFTDEEEDNSEQDEDSDQGDGYESPEVKSEEISELKKLETIRIIGKFFINKTRCGEA
jgi:hypothetical protein